ncbi:hypothetical protein K432DRAFT_380918 [Lepidopterella palustris CBS 459.81]|uniref:Uncharacterized protein n=1 Tax=Lepidopterella palustris CBS 459.81 TaxID=1314670 RepID=A0A8E2ED64_9PEZI|nr:hypothetical protein K432DRAFT_380918 [Lepidopterella palustris CBS 459.81]
MTPNPSEAATQCHLLALPLELREEIWNLCLPKSFGREPYDSEREDILAKSFALPLWEPGSFELLRVCWQIHDEAAPLFWKHNSWMLFTRGKETKIVMGYPELGPQSTARFHLKPFFEIDQQYTRLIRRWTFTFDTGYSLDATGKVTREAEVWAQAKKIMPARLLDCPVASQYLPYRFIATSDRCTRGSESRLSHKHAAFVNIYSFFDALDFVPMLEEVDLAFTCTSSEAKYIEDRGHHFYRGTDMKSGTDLVKFLPRLIEAGGPPVEGSPEDRVWEWLELDSGTDIF